MTHVPQRRWRSLALLLFAAPFIAIPCPLVHAVQTFTGGQVVLQAENMPVKTTGGAVTNGWNIWSNGYIEETVQFPVSGQYQFQVVASGTPASGNWPTMEIRIDQIAIATVIVNSGTWTTYARAASVSAGTHAVAIAFTNDVYVPPEDRNLLVDQVTLLSPSTDTTPPTVSLSAPAGGATVSGTVTVSATASDTVGVAGVQFKVDGAPLGAEDIGSPYAISWNTTQATNGSHSLTAVARDAAGNTATAATVTVTVSNPVADTTPPTGSITINAGAAATKTTAVTLTLSATDNAGAVAQLQVSNDGTTFSTPEAYVITKAWTLTSGDGTKTVWVKFKDAAGNWSAAVSDTIVLDTTPPQLTLTSPANGSVVTP